MLIKKTTFLILLMACLLTAYSISSAAKNHESKDFTLKDMSNNKHTLSQYKGK